MENRFEKCETLIEVYRIFSTGSVEYDNVTEAEWNSLLKLYNAGLDVGVHTNGALTEEAFDEVWDDIIVIGNYTDKAMEESAKNIKGGRKGMKSHGGIITKGKKAAKDISNKVADTVVRTGEDAAEFKKRCDQNITDIKDSLGDVLETLDDITGFSALKEQLYEIIYRNTKGTTSRRGFFDAATECRRAVNDYIENILDYDPDEEDLKTVVQLRYIIGQNENGEDIEETQCIFTAALRGIAWICRKVCRKLKEWFGVNAETNIFGKVGASIASVFGVAAGVIKGALKIALDAVVFIGSYALSAILNCIAVVVEKVSGWFTKAKEKFSKAEEKEDVEDTEENLEEFMEADAE